MIMIHCHKDKQGYIKAKRKGKNGMRTVWAVESENLEGRLGLTADETRNLHQGALGQKSLTKADLNTSHLREGKRHSIGGRHDRFVREFGKYLKILKHYLCLRGNSSHSLNNWPYS